MCSHRIDFRRLSLPVDQTAFQDWAERHLPALRSLFPLNAFCAVLPRALLVEEMTGFLFDPRVAEAFARYQTESSEIVSGDPAVLDLPVFDAAAHAPVYLDTAMPDEPLLAWEKQRWGVGDKQGVPVHLPDGPYRPRSLTGTMIGEYVRHQQCQRWLSFGFLPVEAQPARRTRVDTEVDLLRTERGREHEARVLAYLQAGSDTLLTVAETDEAGARRPLQARFAASLNHLDALVRRVEAAPEQTFYLAQAVLIVPTVLNRKDGWMQQSDGVGIPDLIRISSDEQGVLLAVGDIKDSRAPHDNQKWQVAFYTFLLKELIRQERLPATLRVAGEGFLIMRPRLGSAIPEQHVFDLEPYLAAFPALLRNVGQVLANPPAEAAGKAVLIVPTVLNRKDGWMQQSDGVGIPDLIRISSDEQGVLLAVGDIKDSRAPHDNQKWQVAFYTFLLKELIRQERLPATLRVAGEGFLIMRPRLGSAIPEQHVFDLEPYLAAFPALLRNVGQVLANPPAEAAYQLQRHCTTCPYFEHCYQEALQMEDMLLLPQLTAGTLEKLRVLGLKTAAAAGDWFDTQEPTTNDLFSPTQRVRLAGRLTALRTNRIGLRERKTRLFPANLSTALFIHLVEDPVSGIPRVLGWRVLDPDGAVIDARIWTVADEAELQAVCQAFSEQFLTVWGESIGAGRGPHVFHFGARTWQGLLAWGEGTKLEFLGAPGRLHHTDLRRLLSAHFDLPAPGTLTLFAVGRLLGLEPSLAAPASLFHEDEGPAVAAEAWRWDAARREEVALHVATVLDLQTAVWRWAAAHLESTWDQRDFAVGSDEETRPATRFLAFLEEERRIREDDILSLQAYSLQERVDRFRAIGPLAFSGTALDEEGRFSYRFQTTPEIGLSKFREGDFLKLVPLGLPDLQQGFPIILTENDRNTGRLHVRSRQGRLPLNRRLRYSLEEDLTDWNSPRLNHAVRTVFSTDRLHPLADLLAGAWIQERDPAALAWVQQWFRSKGSRAGLNTAQQQALALPFQYRLSLVEGPPGTGKTHLLAWTLIALVERAHAAGSPLRIVVSALTHQAIDQVLKKVAALVNQHGLYDFPGRCLKWGRWAGDELQDDGAMRVEPLTDREELDACRYLILGATGFGLYRLFEGQKGIFPPFFDWVIFDEASQVLIPQAFLSLLYGKGNALFAGDVHQLPPIVLGAYEEIEGTGVGRSILAHLLHRYEPSHRIRLNQTYRMNAELCRFPSQTWYQGALQPAPGTARLRLVLPRSSRGDLLDRLLDPEKPATLLLVDHRGCHQRSDLEVEIVSQLAFRLMAEQGLSADQLALISPHRVQNNAVAERLRQLLGEAAALPLIDTVERVQGAERDVIVFGSLPRFCS